MASSKKSFIRLTIAATTALLLLLVPSTTQAAHPYEAREQAAAAAEPGENLDALRRHAEVEQLFFGRGAIAHKRLAEALAKLDTGSPEYADILERGLVLAVRDEDLSTAAWFQEQLAQRGATGDPLLSNAKTDTAGAAIEIVGGLDALAEIARSGPDPTPETFLVDYCRAIIRDHTISGDAFTEERVRYISSYFAMARELWGFRDGADTANISFSLEGKAAEKKTRRALSLMGWKLKASRKRVELFPNDGEQQSLGQEYAAALGVDQARMQQQLSNREPFVLEFPVQTAHLLFTEEEWKATLYPAALYPGGFPQAALHDVRIAEVYVGLATTHPAVAQLLRDTIGLERLAKRYSTILHYFSGALALDDGKPLLPGGARTRNLWTNMVGADSSDPAKFFPALLQRDGGRLLGYFFVLSQLGAERQEFFTTSITRTRRFYELFKQAPEYRDGVKQQARANPFAQFLRAFELDDSGQARFPGGPRVWMVAKGEAKATKLERRLDRAVEPEVEDEILIRLAGTKYETALGAKRTQADKLLAVSRVDRGRPDPVSELLALNLAQAFVDHPNVFPTLAGFPGLRDAHVEAFLLLAKKVTSLDGVRRNHVLGTFYSLSALLRLAQAEGSLDPGQGARLFGTLCLQLAQAGRPEDVSTAALAVTADLVAAIGGNPDDADDALRTALLGPPGSAFAWRHDQYRSVLASQRPPALAGLLELHQHLTALREGDNTTPDTAARIAELIRGIPDVEMPKKIELMGGEKDNFYSYSTRKLTATSAQLTKTLSAKKLRQGALSTQASNLLAQLLPQVSLALSAPVYGFYLRPSDLLVADDPLFLRKHNYWSFSANGANNRVFEFAALKIESASPGSYAVGGLGQFGAVAGQIGMLTVRATKPEADSFLVEEFNALRSTMWHRVDPLDFRRLALHVLLAREWIVAAARDQTMARDLGQALFGLVSLSRRAAVLNGLNRRQWPAVWRALTLSDLFFLGTHYRQESQDAGQAGRTVLSALAALGPEPAPASLHWLGAVRSRTLYESHPTVQPDAPYEDYARVLMPQLLAERTAEFKLYLAWHADQLGFRPERLAPLAEPALREIAGKTAPADSSDWYSVIATYRAETQNILQQVATQ